jgi:hypothetical protein
VTKTKRYNVRGMGIDERMKLVEQTIDELIDENEENFRIDMLDDGLPLEDAEESRQPARRKGGMAKGSSRGNAPVF